MTPVADATTEGAETFQICIRTGSVIGSIVATSDSVTVNDTSLTVATGNAIFAFGTTNGSDRINITTLVNSSGAFVSENSGVGTGRVNPGGARYGIDKAIFGYGLFTGATAYLAATNLVDNTGVMSGDQSAITGTARYGIAAAGYGGDKAIFGFGYALSGPYTQKFNTVSNTGVVNGDVDYAPNAGGRFNTAAAEYGGDKAIFAFGQSATPSTAIGYSNLITNTGSVGSFRAAVGSARYFLAAAGYGGDKAIFGFGYTGSAYTAATNLVSSGGVITGNQAALTGTPRTVVAASYGGDKAMFTFGYTGSIRVATVNKVSNSGVVAANSSELSSATVRASLAGAGF
jgi:hypothetical protein